jgi:large conductance mechanosensitive channel
VRLLINLFGTPQPSLTLTKAAGAPTISYGVFLQRTFDFIVIAFVTFLAVKQVNRFEKKARPAPPAGPPPSATPATKFPTM